MEVGAKVTEGIGTHTEHLQFLSLPEQLLVSFS